MIHKDRFRGRDPFIINENGQYYLLYADESGICECAFRDLTHLSAPRPLIDPTADVSDIAAWASPQLCGGILSVTVTRHDGCCGIRLFSCGEYIPGYSTFRPLTGLLTLPEWNCTDGRLFAGHLVFTRRSAHSSSIYTVPLNRDFLPADKPKRILPDAEAPSLWFTEAQQPGIGMLCFCRGKACIAHAASWTPDGAWMKRPLPIPVSGCHAALFEDSDGSFMAAVSTPDGQMQFCYLEWQGDEFALIPQ